MVSLKRYAIELVLFPAINFVDEYDPVCLLLKISVHCRIKKPLLLKMVDEIPSPFFHEVAINLPRPAHDIVEQLARENIVAGFALGEEYPQYENALLVCATETKNDADLEHFAQSLTRALR